MGNLMERRRALMTGLSAIPGAKITTMPTSTTLGQTFADANLELIADNEILLWNIKGDSKQAGGSVGVKFGIIVVQNRRRVENASARKDMASVVAPNLALPSSSWITSYGGGVYVSGGKYTTGGSDLAYIGVGNTIDFIQIPYDVGWNV